MSFFFKLNLISHQESVLLNSLIDDIIFTIIMEV